MKTIAKIAAVAAVALGTVSVAQAQTYSASPQVPNFANPAPLNPVATDGSPLPYSYVPAEPQGVYSGRSVGYGPVGALVGAPVGFAADTAGAAIGTAGNVVDGTVGTVVR